MSTCRTDEIAQKVGISVAALELRKYQKWLMVTTGDLPGLYLIQRGEQFLHFVVMKSVFDPQMLSGFPG